MLVVVIIYEEAFDRVEEKDRWMWIRMALDCVSYDMEKDKISLNTPIVAVPLGYYQKYGNVAVQKAELALLTIQQIQDEEFWAPDGTGCATTITFNPQVKGAQTVYYLDEAIVNDMAWGNGSTAGGQREMIGAKIDNNQCFLKNASDNENSTTAYLYNKIKETIGTEIIINSRVYENSSFTLC